MDDQIISQIKDCWREPEGIFYLLRQGVFDTDKWGLFLGLLQSIDLNGKSTVDLDFVRLLWFVPSFMRWQIERVQEVQGDSQLIENAISTVEEEYIRIWGIP